MCLKTNALLFHFLVIFINQKCSVSHCSGINLAFTRGTQPAILVLAVSHCGDRQTGIPRAVKEAAQAPGSAFSAHQSQGECNASTFLTKDLQLTVYGKSELICTSVTHGHGTGDSDSVHLV